MAAKTEDLQDRLHALVMEVASEHPDVALSIATGLFVSLVLAYARSAGEDDTKEIKINGGDQRDITIHAAKESS